MTTRLLLIRHAQPENHDENGVPIRMSGWTDFPLSARGHEQALRVAARLTNERASLAALYASPLRRAASTAELISHATSLEIGFDPGLKEINCGRVDGLPIIDVQQRFSEAWRFNMQQNNDDFRWPGGESYREFRTRCFMALQSIAERHHDERIAIVTHAGLISQVFGALHQIRPAQWEPYRPNMTALSEVEWDEGPRRALVFDDHAHLDH